MAIRPCDLDPDTNPILHNFAESYSIFYGEFRKINGNYKEAYIFSNPAFTRGPDTVQTLDQNFFGNNMHNNIRTLKFCDCFVGNRLKTVGEFLADGIPLRGQTGWPLNQLSYPPGIDCEKMTTLIISVKPLKTLLAK